MSPLLPEEQRTRGGGGQEKGPRRALPIHRSDVALAARRQKPKAEQSRAQQGQRSRQRHRRHGIGIHRNQLKRIFKRFHRVPSPAVNERSGTGLGLYVVAQLLRSLGGSIRAESPGADLGTTLLVRLPMGVATVEASGS